MWIFCCGMFRSASTLQFQITARLVKEAGIGQQVGWIDWKQFSAIQHSYANEPGLKVMKVHVCSEAIAQEFLNHQAKGIYIFRDVRDVYASYLKQREKSFNFLWNEGFLETCLDNYQEWTTLPNVLVSQYEKVIQDIPTEVKRISEHLEMQLTPNLCQQIAADYRLDRQQKRIEKFRNQLLQTAVSQDQDRQIVDYYDEDSLLHINHINSGKVGKWKEELTPEEADRIENRVKEWCQETRFDPSIFLPSKQVMAQQPAIAILNES
jgi:Sulfotransferase domain